MVDHHEFEVYVNASVIVIAESEEQAIEKAELGKWQDVDIVEAFDASFTEYEKSLQRESRQNATEGDNSG